MMGDKNPAKRLEVRKILSEQKKGKNSPRWGKPISEYQREKIREANRKRKGKKYPNISKALKERYKDKTKHGRYKGDNKSSTQRRRAFKMGVVGSHNLGEWNLLKKQYGYCCPSCGKYEPEIKLTEDHIIPLSKGGSDYIENIQPLCGDCNRRKYTKTIKYENRENKGDDCI